LQEFEEEIVRHGGLPDGLIRQQKLAEGAVIGSLGVSRRGFL
jgi:hypothetical protein